MHVSAQLKQRITDKIQECLRIAERRYGQKFEMPHVIYALRGTTAGTANYRTWTIDLNAVLLNENVEDFISDTVPHEVAHLITDRVYPEAHESRGMVWTRKGYRRAKRSVHGPEWQSVMRVLGVDPSRCHTYDTTNAKTRVKAIYAYKCSCCQEVLNMGPKRHAKEQAAPGTYWHSKCGRTGRLVYQGANRPTQAPVFTRTAPDPTARPTQPAAPAAPKAPEAGSKLSRCYDLYKQHYNLARKDMIQLFVQMVGCTPAGASTYQATCKKMYEAGVR